MAKKSTKTPTSEVQKWLGIIKAYDTEYASWEKRVGKILKRYRDEKTQENRENPASRFNILWSNVQTLIPAVFARMPQPDVSRRFSDRDPVGRVAAMILERALDFEIQHYKDFRSTMKQCVHDRFLGGRGTAWARYEPHIRAQALQEPVDGTQVTEDVDEPQEELEYECAPVDYVHWRDFGHTVARTWEEVTAVWRKVYMTKDACISRFGEELGNKIPMDANPEELKRSDRENPELAEQQRACVYELWDKEKLEAIWLSKSMKQVLDRKDDPLELEGFFPCPDPLYATLTNESLIPVPDFTLYQDQAIELDILCDRIDGLVKALQVKGVYDASMGPEIARLFTDSENTDLRPVKNWQAFAEKNGLKGAIDIVDMTPIAKALEAAYAAMQQIVNQVHEITGISDIIRGQTEASETATAQQIKGQYAGLRLRDMQQGVAVFATELIRLKAQIISGFDQQTLIKIAAVEQLAPEDQQYVMPALQLIADKPLRNFRIEIAADSLVQIDEKEHKESVVELMTAIGAFLEKSVPVVQAAPPLLPMIMEMLKFSVRAFKVGRPIEGVIDQALEQLKQQAQQPPPPDPAVEAEKARAQADMQKAQMDVQVAKTKAGIDIQKSQAEMQLDRERMGMEQQFQQQDMQLKQQEHQMSMQQQQQAGAMKSQQMAAQHAQKMKQASMQPKRPQ